MMQNIEVVVLGAGWYGLKAARTYLEVQPSTNLLILESNSTVGGTWAQDRIYPGLRTQNVLGMYEYADYPMSPMNPPTPGNFIPGQHIHDYLESYVDHFGLRSRIRFNTTVKRVTRNSSSEGWVIELHDDTLIRCEKLIVATGLTSESYIPPIPRETFTAPCLHAKSLATEAKDMIANPDVKSVTVYGGAKSAFDAVYIFASTGIHVDWVIRENGQGPAWMAPSKLFVWPSANITHNYFSAILTPSIWAGDDFSDTWAGTDGWGWFRWLLHQTFLGAWLIRLYWQFISNGAAKKAGYDFNDNSKQLRPDHQVFWATSNVGVNNYPTDVFALVRSEKVTIHRKDMTELKNKSVYLSDGTNFETDAVVFATGWKVGGSMSIFPKKLAAELGLPRLKEPIKEAKHWASLAQKADQQISTQYPTLAMSPIVTASQNRHTPFRLYRHMAPANFAAQGDRSIVFLGMLGQTSSALIVGSQCLWATAYLLGRLNIPDKQQLEWEIALTNQFVKRRYPGAGKAPELLFDFLVYAGMLLRDAGVNQRRKSLLAHLFTGHNCRDYKDVVNEWMVKEGISVEKKFHERKIDTCNGVERMASLRVV